MKRKVVGVASAVVALWVLSSCYIESADLGGPTSSLSDINESGVAVGASDTLASTPGHPESRGIRRLADGTVLDLGTLPGHAQSSASAINDAGVVVGNSWTVAAVTLPQCPQAGVPRAVTWSAAGAIANLGVLPGHCWSEAHDINDAGVVVGTSSPNAFLAYRAFLYDPAVGAMQELPRLAGATWASAEAINDSGKVLGRQSLASGTVVVQWDLVAGTVTNLTASSGLKAVGDINDAGVIAGAVAATYPNGSATTAAAILAPGSSTPTLLGTGPGSAANAIDESGVVLGTIVTPQPVEPGPVVTPAGWDRHMFRWAAGSFADLAGADHQSSAGGSNDAGQMVGSVDDRAALFVVS